MKGRLTLICLWLNPHSLSLSSLANILEGPCACPPLDLNWLTDSFLPEKSITLPTVSIIHTTGEETWKHILLCHSGHLWAHRLRSITTGLRPANTDYTSGKNSSWKPPVTCLMASPAYENPDISAKWDSKPQETAHSASEEKVTAARPQVHRKNPRDTLSCPLALEKRHMACWDPHWSRGRNKLYILGWSKWISCHCK